MRRTHISFDAILRLVASVASLALSVEGDIGVNRPLSELGMESFTAHEIRNRLRDEFDTSLSPTIAYDYPSVQHIATHIASLLGEQLVKDTLLEEGREISSDSTGMCHTFDDKADGYIRGEGCGVIVLKRLQDAIVQGDNVLAIIRGSAVNQDGRSSGLTAPNGVAQQQVIRSALQRARVKPSEVSMVEAHGTGTNIGDTIEVQALMAVYGQDKNRTSPFFLGSIKTNVGHTEGAAGIAGLIKVVLSLQHSEVPPHAGFTQLNTLLPPLEAVGAIIPTKTAKWNAHKIAATSSFGFSGPRACSVHTAVRNCS